MHIPASTGSGNFLYIVDALDGITLSKNDGMIKELFTSLLLPQPQTYVYLHHPGIDGSITYINPLMRVNTSGYIQGTYADIQNSVTSRAYSSIFDFRYDPSNTHFDEANLYYHIDNFRTGFWNMLDDVFGAFAQITAHAHHNYDAYNNYAPNNAYYLSSNGSYISAMVYIQVITLLQKKIR